MTTKFANKKINFIKIILAVFLLIGILFSVSACSKQTAVNNTTDNNINNQSISQGEDLIIPVNEVTETAKFYPITVNGTDMEVIAVRDSTGNIRTAFNTCQICYDSGRGYYKQEGNALVCQNCGNRFTVDQIEVEAGGCNPYPIFISNKTVTEESITISYDFLVQSSKIFANWKSSY